MIDPLLSLSFNLHAQQGTYALLLGSGISRSAGVPTGWEVTLDLVAKLAHMQHEDCAGDAAAWYAEKFGKEPDYAEVLSAVASTSAAQQALLKGYFEPTEAEREEGKKLPTEAHHAIAQLVSSGHIKVIVTTNFDRLLETALEAAGIAPVVVASPDAVKGAPPLAHSKCTVIKVHGDYLDHRIKNSPEALAKYDKATDRLLDQVFDEYGLIVCGWSGEYDVALRKALERSKVRRYPMYWAGPTEPQGASKDLIAHHGAHHLTISGADGFFNSLVEETEALSEFDRPHPLSCHAAVVSLKRYLGEDRYRIQLRDFLMEEARQTCSSIGIAFSHVEGVSPNQQSGYDLMQRLEAGCEKLVHLFANGSFYGRPEHAKPHFDAFNLIVSTSGASSGHTVWSDLRKYPALLLTYSAGIAAAAAENYAILHDLAGRTSRVEREVGKGKPAPVRIHVHNTIDRDVAHKLIPGMERHKTPVSDRLFDVLREPFKVLLPDDLQYELAFDDFEYLWCLLHVDARKQSDAEDIWTPYGAFVWRRWRQDSDWLKGQAQSAADHQDTSWPPLRYGLFGGSAERLSEALGQAAPTLNDIVNMYMR